MNKKFSIEDLRRCLVLAKDLIEPFGQTAMPASFNGRSLQGGTLHFLVQRYAHAAQWLKIQLLWFGDEGFFEPFDSMSKVVPNLTINPTAGEFIFDAYDTRLKYRSEMLATGYFKDTGQHFGEYEVWQITDKFLTAFAAANSRAIDMACAAA